MYRLKQGDEVVVVAGAEKGKRGTVTKVDREGDRLTVQGINVRYKHVRRSQQYQQGGRVQVEVPIHISNVMLVDPETGKPTRVRIETEDGKKFRVAVKSGTRIDK